MRWSGLGLLLAGAASALFAVLAGNDRMFALLAGAIGAAAGAVAGLSFATLKTRRLRTASLLATAALIGLGGPAAAWLLYRDVPDGGGLATATLMALAAIAGLGLAATAGLHALTARFAEPRQQRVALSAGLVMAVAAAAMAGAAPRPPISAAPPVRDTAAPAPEQGPRQEPAAPAFDSAATLPLPPDTVLTAALPPTTTDSTPAAGTPDVAVDGTPRPCTAEDPPILLAVDTRDPEEVRRAIAAGADVHACVDMGEGGIAYALPEAMALDAWAVVDVLLEAGADPNLVAPGDNLPLELAIRAGRTELVARLITSGARVDTWSGGAPLITTAARTADPGILRLLLDAGANPDEPFYGEAPLHIVVTAASSDPAALLLDAGASVDARDRAGRTPLVVAAGLGRIETVQLLLDAGSRDLEAAVEAAIMGGHQNVAAILRTRIDAGG